METSEFLCARCARYMATCCQTSEIYATPGDVDRIASHTGRSDFYEFRAPENPVYLEQSDDPLWERQVFKDDRGTRRILKREKNGDCTFLSPHGCVLPLEIRPLVCRLYPYDYTEQGIREQLANGCPVELLHPQQTLLGELDIKRSDAERWHAQLYSELPLESTANDYRANV